MKRYRLRLGVAITAALATLCLAGGVAQATDVGAQLQLVGSITQVSNSPYYFCTYGENHLWDSSGTQNTAAAGTTAKSGPFCANLQTASQVAVSAQLVFWVQGRPTSCDPPWGATNLNATAVSSDWWVFPDSNPPCGHGVYSLTSAHNFYDNGIPGWQGGGFLSSGFKTI